MSEAYRCNLYNTSARRAKSLVHAAELTSSVQSHIGEQVVHQRKGVKHQVCVSGSTLNRQVTSFQSFRIFFSIFLFLFEVKCSLTVMSWQDYGSIVASSAEINRIAQPTVAGYPTTKNRHSSVCKPWLCQTPAAHASKAARFYISPCPPHPPLLFFFGCWTSGAPEGAPP